MNAGAFLAWVAAVPCGSLESCEVAMPTVLLNSYVVPARVAKSIAIEALRGPWLAVIASCLVVKASCEA